MKYCIVAYVEADEGYLPRQEVEIEAADEDTAYLRARMMFPEYHENWSLRNLGGLKWINIP